MKTVALYIVTELKEYKNKRNELTHILVLWKAAKSGKLYIVLQIKVDEGKDFY